jgi:hypothetical protein
MIMISNWEAKLLQISEVSHRKIYRFEKGIEHFSRNITQHIHDFHQYIFALGSSILEIPHPKSRDRLPSKFPV